MLKTECEGAEGVRLLVVNRQRDIEEEDVVVCGTDSHVGVVVATQLKRP